MLPSRASCSLGAPGAWASSSDITGDNSSQATGNVDMSSAAIASGSPTIMATASPRKRTSSSGSANTG